MHKRNQTLATSKISQIKRIKNLDNMRNLLIQSLFFLRAALLVANNLYLPAQVQGSDNKHPRSQTS